MERRRLRLKSLNPKISKQCFVKFKTGGFRCVIFYEGRTRTVNAQTGDGDGIKPVIGLKLLQAADDGR